MNTHTYTYTYTYTYTLTLTLTRTHTHTQTRDLSLCRIFERGSLRCIGSSNQLKHRFEKCYKLTITTTKGAVHEAALKELVQSIVPGYGIYGSISVYLTSHYVCEFPLYSISQKPNDEPHWRHSHL